MIAIGCHGSGCFPQPAGREVNLSRRPAAKRLVRARGVVEAEESLQPGCRVGDRVVGIQVDLLVLDTAPQPFDEHDVELTALAVHADTDAGLLEPADELTAGELTALVGVEDLRRPETPQGLVQRGDRFKARTGCPVLVNTSFNVRGEPLVCTPEDAFHCFMGTEMEVLVAGHCLLRKQNQDPALKLDYKDAFEPD